MRGYVDATRVKCRKGDGPMTFTYTRLLAYSVYHTRRHSVSSTQRRGTRLHRRSHTGGHSCLLLSCHFFLGPNSDATRYIFYCIHLMLVYYPLLLFQQFVNKQVSVKTHQFSGLGVNIDNSVRERRRSIF